ncbi:HAMP domain-containing histidine kinase [Vagococcus sp. BWB3-3]|uniref:histidine kinase n=1 Tax=Vagococcus allomyrinae TaxID=2794353 RepID=A0A940PBD4_9ENTE|nr:HAMP domain-containing sensor histidine kinase [Vagococcus allomyrinae]MBP1040908.1 HAMP domain-containing histidine kinase [Vagococcus allomyrinae]
MREQRLAKKYPLLWLLLTVAFVAMIYFVSQNYLVLLLVLLMSGGFWLLGLGQGRQQEKELQFIADLLRTFLEGRLMSESSQLKLKETLSGKISHELLRLEEQYSGYQAKINHDQQVLQQLISDIAHQLRTPLVNIKTYSSLLKQSADLSTTEQTYVNAIELSESQLTFLIESFIKMSRFENDLIQLKVSPNNVNELLLATVFSLHSAALGKNIDIKFENNEPIIADYDSNWLGEALFNVLDNSIKYSFEDSVISLQVSQNEMFTVISCRDWGIGIERGEEHAIFQRFYRGERIDNQAGFGIGLYLAQEIMLKHHGFIKVTREDQGLTVSLYF